MSRTACSLALCAAFLAACSEKPTMENMAGSYHATSFTVQQGAAPAENVLADGSLLDLTLIAAGTTSGRLFVPGGAEGGGDFDADLTGTWTLLGTAVTFDHVADTFVRDMPFTAKVGQLTGEATFGGATIRVVLER